MSAVDFVIPGSLDTRTGGYRYDKRIIEELRANGSHVTVHQIDDSFPHPTAAAEREADDVLAGIADGSPTVIDGLAYSVMPDVLARHADRLCLIALIHHPLALETGLAPKEAERLKATETLALTHAQHVITTSPSTTASLSDYGVSATRISTIEPGTDPAKLSGGSEDERTTLLCVATVTERKGHRVLVDALAQVSVQLPDHAWVCHCVGSPDRDLDTVDALRKQISTAGLEHHIHLHGEADDTALARFYATADVFVLPSYHEGYGMVLGEAIAYGLPVVSTTAGAIPDTVPKGSGLLVPPGDADALAQALISILSDADTLQHLRTGARTARDTLRRWEQAGLEFGKACNTAGATA